MNTIQELYDYFILNYASNTQIVSNSSLLYNNSSQPAHLYTVNMHESICEKAFINIFLLWEYFLEQSFILYLCGSNDLKGNTYQKYALPIDSEHAYKLLRGTKKYPDWTNLDDVNTFAELYFESSGPFNMLRNKPIEFSEMKIIRNKISHMSAQSDKQFKGLLARKIGQNQNISVTQFLLKMVDGNNTYFTYYTEFIMGFVDIISNK